MSGNPPSDAPAAEKVAQKDLKIKLNTLKSQSIFFLTGFPARVNMIGSNENTEAPSCTLLPGWIDFPHTCLQP
jgi:hypothetical protein